MLQNAPNTKTQHKPPNPKLPKKYTIPLKLKTNKNILIPQNSEATKTFKTTQKIQPTQTII